MRVETIGDATLYLGDAAVVLPTLPTVDALVTDPPYGIKEAAGKNASRSNLAAAKDYGDDEWDNEPVQLWLLQQAIHKARHAVIFGGNYYALPPSSCWLVWDKENGDNDFADCELAWTNLRKAVRRINYRWNGMLRANGETRGDHPTQKPVGVMEWAIMQLPDDSQTILDPFMGSGTTGLAALALGRKFIGIERERKYFDAAVRRLSSRQERLFA
jgi:site-specific DNA-methyltransferase (adenine-specific)/modification methylase